MSDVLVLTNGRIVDGTGAPWFWGTVVVKGDRIDAVLRHRVNPETVQARFVDVQGSYICPGFIDVHGHSDIAVLAEPSMVHKVAQGVTTEIMGNCGLSVAPLSESPDKRDMWKEYVEYVLGDYEVEWSWGCFGDYLEAVEGSRPAVNVGCLVGHCAVRAAVCGFEPGPADDTAMRAMRDLVSEAMESGAIGLSTGLGYPPGAFAEPGEITELAGVVARYGGIYVTHMRNESDRLLDSVREALQVGRSTGIAVHISHHKASQKKNWGKVNDSLRVLREARDDGLNVSVDVYPYTGGSGYLSALLPVEVWRWGPCAAWDVLRDTQMMAELRRSLEVIDWTTVQLRGIRSADNRHLVGKTVADAAREMGADPVDLVMSLLIRERGAVLMTTFGALSEDDVRTVLGSDLAMVASDGLPAREALPHPRTYGTFTRLLSTYVFREKVLPLEKAVMKCTSYPAQVFGLRDRGLIRPGYRADLVVINPELLDDGATFEDPRRISPGVRWVIVNGQAVMEDGTLTTARPGRVIRRS